MNYAVVCSCWCDYSSPGVAAIPKDECDIDCAHGEGQGGCGGATVPNVVATRPACTLLCTERPEVPSRLATIQKVNIELNADQIPSRPFLSSLSAIGK